MQKQPILQDPIDPCFAMYLPIFTLHSTPTDNLNLATSFCLEDLAYAELCYQSASHHISSSLPAGEGSDGLNLTVCNIDTGATPRFDLRQTEQASTAHLDEDSRYIAAPGSEQ